MSNRLKLTKSLLMSCSALIPALLAAEAQAQAVNLGGTGNLIIPDGRTQTQVTSAGNTTDITTKSVSGHVGFNSFSQFQVGGGNNVNLHLPQNTDTLVNIVRDGPAVVEGTVNALKSGAIGGNVVFSDPYGFVLGSQGVINTGSLTVNTPTREFLEGAINGNGEIDTSITNRLISGDVPLAPGGAVVLNGKVNATNNIAIQAGSIDVGDEAALERHRDMFEATVNTSGGGIVPAASLVVENGRIELRAAGKVSIGAKATITAVGSTPATAGTVSIKSGGDLSIASGASVKATASQGSALVRLASGGQLVLDGDILALGENAANAQVEIAANSVSMGASGSIAVRGSAANAGSGVAMVAATDIVLDGRVEGQGAGIVEAGVGAFAGGTNEVETSSGARIALLAEGDIRIGSAGMIDASATADGGHGGDIYVIAQRDLSVADGARFTSRGAGTGNGGFLDLSGRETLSLGKIGIDLRSSGSGSAGSLLIDPQDMIIADATQYVRGAMGSLIDNVAEVTLRADTITIANGGQINTYKAGANALGVRLQAQTIAVEQGGLISADADAGFKRGSVTLTALDSETGSKLLATAKATIEVNGKIVGDAIHLRAEAKAITSAIDDLTDTAGVGIGSISTDVLGGALLGLQGGYVGANGTAKVIIGSTAELDATGNITLAAEGTQTASNLGLNPGVLNPLQLTTFFGEVTGTTAAEIMGGARIKTGKSLTVSAVNTMTLGVTAMSIALSEVPVVGAVAGGVATVRTNAVVHSGADLEIGGDVTILADNTNSLSVTATAMGMGSAVAGLGLAIHVSDLQANARLGADLGTDAARVGHVRVSAISDTLLNKNQASTSLGDNKIVGLIRGKIPDTKSIATLAGKIKGLSVLAGLTPPETMKGGFALMYAQTTASADASIAADVSPTTSTGWAPSIVSSGNVSVLSSVYDAQIRSDAEAGIESNEQGTSNSPQATDAAAVAIAIGTYEHKSHATIGRNVSIAAQNLGISAKSDVPVVYAYNTVRTPAEILKLIIGTLNGNLGVVNNVVTSYAGSTVAARDVGIAGSVNFLGVSHDTQAWIGSGAKIVTRSSGETYQDGSPVDPQGWIASLGSNAGDGTPQTKVFQAGVDVQAMSRTETINLAGVPAWFIAFGGNEIQGGEGKSGGGSLNLNLFNTTTQAGIGAGVSISSQASVSVDAKTIDSVVAVAPSSGKGAALGINGLMSYLGITNSTSASISNKAIVSARAVAVNATQDTLIVSVSGSLSRGTGSNVGLSAAWSNYETTTSAFIGDNSDAVEDTALANYSGLANGEITSNQVKVGAHTAGANYTMSVAAAISAPETGESGAKDSLTGGISAGLGNLSTKLSGTITGSASKMGKLQDFFSEKISSGLGKISSALEPAPPPQGQTRKVAISGAGSVSGVTTAFDTLAYIDGPTIRRLGNTGAVAISVQADNDLLISTTSGSASLALAGSDSAQSSAAVAGAFAVAFTNNQTSAAIRNVTATDVGAVSVRGLASGQQVVLGLAVAANTNANKALSIAGSLSFGGSIDGVSASIEGSTLEALAGNNSDAEVLAYQNTDIGIGGLAVSVSTKGGGFGLALTGTVLADPTGGHAASARILNSNLRSFRNVTAEAITVSRVLSGAGSVGVTPSGLGINGSIVFNDVSTSTIAEIKGDGTQDISTTGDVAVRAGSERRTDVELALNNVIRNKTINTGFDFSDRVLGTGTTGAVIFGVSGTVGVGQNNAGVAIQYGGIRHSHEAYLSGVTLVASGDLTVSARDESKIFGTAAGVSVGTGGGFAGAGSLSINVIANTTLAKVYGSNTSVTARNIAVGAYNASTAGGGVGAVAVSAEGTGIGLSLINNTIANTTEALVESASLTANGSNGNVVVGAQSSGKLVTFAVSVGAGGTVGVGGSVATSVALNNSRALVRGATLVASNNVLVSATNDDQIHAVAGGVGISLKAAGVGVSTVANIVRGETLAAIEDLGNTHSVVKTGAAGTDLAADSGNVDTPFAYSALDIAKSLVTLLPDMSFSSTAINGLGVVATSRQSVGSFSLAASAAVNVDTLVSVAASVAPVVNVLGGDTTARITNALVNADTATNGANADIKVIAASNTFTQNVVIGAAAGTGLAAAAGFVSNVMERNTTAEIVGATIGSTGNNVDDLLVRATGTMDSLNFVAGVAVGPVGGAGSMVVNVFDAHTLAQLNGGSVTARNVAVEAESTTGFLGVAGAGAAGSVAVAGAMNVSVNLGSTKALVGNGTDTRLVLAEDLEVTATSTDTQRAFVVGAALSTGGGAGVAAMLNLSAILSDTIASVNKLTQSSMRDVAIAASNTTKLLPVTGGLGFAADGVGVGAGANVMLTKGTVASEVINSAFTARGALDVAATGTREIDMITFTAGVGGSAGIGAALGIIVAGVDMSSDAKNELGGTLSAANAQANQSTNSQFVQSGTPGQRNTDGDTRDDVVASSVNSTKRDSVTAKIANSTITSGATTVVADSKVGTNNTAVGAGVGGVGVGAALAFTFVNQDVAATITGGHLTASSLAIKAVSNALDHDPAIKVAAYAGAGGLAGGLGAAVAVAHVESDVTANLTGTVTGGSGKVEVRAEDGLAVHTDAVGASAAGGVAVGISLALSSRNADISAHIGANSIVTAAHGVSVAAKSFGASKAEGTAGAGGLVGAGVGASATALDETNVLAQIGDTASLTGIGAGGVSVTAEATPEVKARSIGVAVAGSGAVGASVSVAKADLTVSALLGTNVTITSAGAFKALADLKAGGNPTLDSQAIAGAGALYLAANATVSQALLKGETTAAIGSGVNLELGTNDAEIKATSRTRQRTDTTGVAVSLGLSLGANVAEVSSESLTQASIGNNATVTARHLTLEANGQDDNYGKAVAGGGGIVSGSAAAVTNTAGSRTFATLGGTTVTSGLDLSGKLTVKAAHENVLGGTVDSINAGIVGASGAVLLTDVDSTVTAKLDDNARVSAANFDLIANNVTRKPWEGSGSGDAADWNLNSGSGGILNLPAGSSRSTVSHATTAAFGANAKVALDGGIAPSKADVQAHNSISFFDKVKLDSGGAIALADTRTYLTVTRNEATASFGEGAALVAPNGNVRVAAYDSADIDLRAASTTYGLAGAPTGTAEVDYRRANLVRVGKNVRIEANSADDLTTGKLTVAAGAALDGALSRIVARTTLDLYNNSAIPISVTPNPITRVSGNSTLQLDGGSTLTSAGLRAAGDIVLVASRGSIDASAVGTGKDIYREALAAIASGVSELFGGDPVSFDYKGGETHLSGLGTADINGVVLTGIDRNKSVTINYATADVNGCLVATTICLALPVEGEIAYTTENNIPIGLTILDRIKELRQLMSDYGSDPVAKAAYQSEITFLEAKLVALGLIKDGGTGAFVAPSELDEKKIELERSKLALNGLGAGFDAASDNVSGNSNTVATQGGSVDGYANDLRSASGSASSKSGDVVAGIAGLTNYGGSNADSNAADLAEINRLKNLNTGYVSDIATAQTQLSTAKSAVSEAQARIETRRSFIAVKLNEIRNKPYGAPASEIAALQNQIETAREAIATDTAIINTNLPTIQSATESINNLGTSIKSNLTTISSRQANMLSRSRGGSGDDAKVAAINANIGQFDGFASTVSGRSGSITTSLGTVQTNVAGSTASIGTVNSYLSNRTTLRTAISTIETGIANNSYSATGSNTPTTGAVTIADTVARLGDIFITADQLTGTGDLRAPGNASIDITNNTGHTLKLGNLTIDSDSGGRIRFNGAEVNSTADINALNKGGVSANFGQLVTAITQGSPMPSISIRSNYTSDSATFYNSSSEILAVKTPRPAPDIILLKDRVLTNPRGAVSILSEAGNIYMHGETDAGSVSITAKNGDFVQGFVYGFEHVAGDPGNGVATGGGITANGAINMSARYLNINGRVQSGIAQWNLTIGQNPWVIGTAQQVGLSQSTIDAVAAYVTQYRNAQVSDRTYVIIADQLKYVISADGQGGRYEFTTSYAQSNAANGTYKLVDTVGNIGASYDRQTNKFVVDGTNVRGGSIQIYGQILNTASSGGELNVLDGFGTINIVNNDGREVVLGKLDTGEDPTGTGRGIAGRIEITDIYGLTSNAARPVTAVRTVYTRNNGLMTSVRDTGYINSDGTFVVESNLTSTKSGGGWAYDPQTGIRFNYTTAVDFSEKIVSQYSGTQFLGNTDWRVWEQKTADWQTRTTLDSYRLKDGTYVSFNTGLGSKSVDHIDGNTVVTLIDEWSDCNWWTLCIAQDYTVILEAITPKKTITTNTLKADNPIAINFIGQSSGSVSVQSGSSVHLAGVINNRTGSTSITSSTGDIAQANPEAMINSNAVTLSATAGSVGALGTGNAVRVSLGSGELNATAGNGNVVIDAASGINVGTIKASGSVASLEGRVVLTAAGSINGTSSSLIEAPRVELTSINGAIGSATNLLKVNTGFSSTAADRPFGDPASGQVLNTYYGLKANAVGDIGITSGTWTGNSTATMLVDQVVSTGGNVRLKTEGAILDNNPIQSVDTRTYNELLAYWNDLGLVAGAENTAKVNAVIKSFETQIASERQIYLQMRARQGDGGAAYDPNFVYRMTASEKLAFGETLRLGDSALTQSEIDTQITAFETQQTDRYHRVEAQLAGLTGNFDAGTGLYTASAAERATRGEGAVWSERQLAFSLSAGALKTITGTNPVLKAANVSGRAVALEAGLGLGEVAGSIQLPTNILPSALTDAQKIALATAERGDFSYSNGVLTIQSIRPLNVSAADQLTASISAATGNAYLASLGDARLGTISVPGELRLKVRGSIMHANAQSPAVSAGSFILEASNGGIGSYRDLNGNLVAGTLRVTAVNTSGTPGAYKGSIIARAGLDLSLKVDGVTGTTESGDANIDTVYSRGNVKITADKSVRNASGDALINVLGTTVDIKALEGAIGSSTSRLNVGNELGGRVDLASRGNIYAHGPSGYQLNLRTLVAGGAVDVTAAGNLTLSGLVTAPVSATFAAAGQLAMSQGVINAGTGGVTFTAGTLRMLTAAGISSAGGVDITTTGDAQVTNIASSATGSNAIRIQAGGRILAGTAQSRTDLAATAPGAAITLVAGNGIGNRQVANTTLAAAGEVNQLNHLRLRAGLVSATSTNGEIAIHALDGVKGSSFINTSGALIDIVADDDLTASGILAGNGAISSKIGGKLAVGTLAAGTAMTVEALGDLTVTTAEAGGTMRLTSGGHLGFDSLRTNGTGSDLGDIHLTSRGGTLNGREADANGGLLANAKGQLAFTTLRATTMMDLVAGTDLSGSSILVRKGALGVKAGGNAQVDSIAAGHKATVDAMGSLRVKTALGGGTMRLSSGGNLGFDSLRTNGAGTDIGDIYVTSRGGTVRGREADANGGLLANAKGQLAFTTLRATTIMDLVAGTDLSGSSILVRQGAFGAEAGGNAQVGTIAAGQAATVDALGSLRVKTASAGGTMRLSSGGDLVFDYLKTLGIAGDAGDIHLRSHGASVLGGEVDSNGSLFVNAKDQLVFARLRSGKDMDLTAGGSVKGSDLDVGGELRFDFAGSDPIHLAKVTGSELRLQGGGPLRIDRVDVSKSASFQAPDTVVGVLNHTGPGILQLDVTGYRGGVADRAAMTINAPGGVDVDQLYLLDGRFKSNGPNFTIGDAFIPGSLEWGTPWRTFWMNNRNQTPVLGNDVQLYDPGFAFSMSQTGSMTRTDSYVVRYGSGSQIGMLRNGETYLGASFVRDFERALQAPGGGERLGERRSLGWGSFMTWARTFIGAPVTSVPGQPAVNLGEQKESEEVAALD